MNISAMILGKDEDYHEYCLASIKDIVDEIVISDLKVDDFAMMRNECLEKIKGDWVLVLDSDEILANPDGSPVTRKQLDDLIDRADREGASGYHFFTLHFLYNYRMIDGSNNGQHYSYGRFYRKKDIEMYKGKIHELPQFKFGQNLIPCRTIWIWHFGHCKGMEYIRRKYERTMQIPDNPFRNEFKGMNVDEYCKQHQLFTMAKPIIHYNGPLPRCMNLW